MKNYDFHLVLKQDNDWNMERLHFHESIELMLVLSDGGEFFFEKSIYPLRKNMLFVLDTASLHRTVRGTDGTLYCRYVMNILPSALQELSTAETDFVSVIHRAPPCIQLKEEQANELMEMFRQLSTQKQNEFGDDIRRKIYLLEILLYVSQIIRNSSIQKGVSNMDYDKIEPILQYIQQFYAEPIRLDDISKKFLVSKYYLCHRFKEVTGFSVMEYVIQRRLIESQKFLRQSMTVQEVAERSGFQNYAHFIRTFSKHMGISPKQYAKQYQQGQLYVHFNNNKEIR